MIFLKIKEKASIKTKSSFIFINFILYFFNIIFRCIIAYYYYFNIITTTTKELDFVVNIVFYGLMFCLIIKYLLS